MNKTIWSPEIPSYALKLLERLVGQRITRLTRYSWWPKEAVPTECGIAPEDSFSLAPGSLAIGFENGEVLGVTSDPHRNSVVIWLDRDSRGNSLSPPAMDEDEDAFPIDASDPVFSQRGWADLVGTVLTGASVLHMHSGSALKKELPSEVGLCLELGVARKLIAAHGLHDGSDDFAVLPSDAITPAVRSQLEEKHLL